MNRVPQDGAAPRLVTVGKEPAPVRGERGTEGVAQDPSGATASPLFEAHPTLARRIPWRPLADLPTPVERMASPPSAPWVRLFVKRDDLSSHRYGGNKVRKLEHLIAAAEARSCDTLITLGAIGSNHALAVASHGSALGFGVDLALYDQPVNAFVRRNLGGFLAAGARLHHAGNIPLAFLTCARLFRRLRREGRSPFFVMVGGTSRLGCLGHVGAAFELAGQVERGELPEPDYLFVPLGTCGTAAGLITGLRLAGLRTRVAAVRVAEPISANAIVLRHLAQDAADYLRAIDPSVPKLNLTARDFDVLPGYIGPGYGHPTASCIEAVGFASPQVSLETTYTGKALAACLDFCSRHAGGCTILFWNTYNSAPIPAPADWSGLPTSLNDVITAAEHEPASTFDC